MQPQDCKIVIMLEDDELRSSVSLHSNGMLLYFIGSQLKVHFPQRNILAVVGKHRYLEQETRLKLVGSKKYMGIRRK